MNVLLIGSGGREHALAWKLVQSPRLTQLYCLPGNPGTAGLGTNLAGDALDLPALVATARQLAIDLVVVGPEEPLAAGLADALRAAGIPVYGPSAAAARLESSKAFAKDFMVRCQIPTAAYRTFTEFEAAWRYYQHAAAQLARPLPVIKASGLAAGKGVILPVDLAQAEQALRQIMLAGRFGRAGAQVVIEECLVGREVSLLAFCDGYRALPMLPAQDHKRLLDGDQGPNTGGMGVFAPSPFAPAELVDWVVEQVMQPTLAGLRAEGQLFVGTLYAGLILTENGPQLLEFNCRFGDPETQAILPLLDGDLLEILTACTQARLTELAPQIRWKPAASVCVVLAAPGYPQDYPKDLPISGLQAVRTSCPAVEVFHAGTRQHAGQIVTSGGRVLGVTATAASLPDARTLAYQAAAQIHFEGMQSRTDIAAGMI